MNVSGLVNHTLVSKKYPYYKGKTQDIIKMLMKCDACTINYKERAANFFGLTVFFKGKWHQMEKDKPDSLFHTSRAESH